MYVVNRTVSKDIIHSLDTDCLKDYALALASALAEYSSNPERLPKRTVYESAAGVHLVMPSLVGANDSMGLKMIVGGKSNGFNGITIVQDEAGNPWGMIDALHTTAFRTALATSLAWSVALEANDSGVRSIPSEPKDAESGSLPEVGKCNVTEITVLGSGLQAYYHAWLAAKEFSLQRIYLWNRTAHNAEKLRDDLRNGNIGECEITIVDSVDELERAVRSSQMIFGCIPSLEPVLKHDWLANGEARFVSLIGSYKPPMHELLGSDVAELALTGDILVDSKEAVLDEAGEIIDAKIPESKLVEVGRISSGEGRFVCPKPYALWKCVGLSIMDVAVGRKLIESAEKKGLGVRVDLD